MPQYFLFDAAVAADDTVLEQTDGFCARFNYSAQHVFPQYLTAVLF